MSALDYVLSHVVSVVAVLLRYAILSLEYCLRNHPHVTTYVIAAMAAYVAFRMFMRLIRMWVNFFVSAAKLAVFVGLIVLLALIYARGPLLFTQDLPSLRLSSLMGMIPLSSDSVLDNFDAFARLSYAKLNHGIWSALTRGLFAVDDLDDNLGTNAREGIKAHFTKENLKYAMDNFDMGKASDFVSENFEGIDNLLKQQGFNLNDYIGRF